MRARIAAKQAELQVRPETKAHAAAVLVQVEGQVRKVPARGLLLSAALGNPCLVMREQSFIGGLGDVLVVALENG